MRLSSDELTNCLRREVISFRDALRQQEGQRNGQIQLEFFEKRSTRNWFGDGAVPWEIWILKLDVVRLNNESGKDYLQIFVCLLDFFVFRAPTLERNSWRCVIGHHILHLPQRECESISS